MSKILKRIAKSALYTITSFKIKDEGQKGSCSQRSLGALELHWLVYKDSFFAFELYPEAR